jgi:molybdopterin-guanine dinucleotide biosynthesis protein A
MLQKPRSYDVLAPRADRPGVRNRRGVEPLHTIYARGCLPAMQAALGHGELRIAALYDELRVSYLEADEIRTYDPAGLALLSINTPEDEATARRVLAAQAH